MESRRIELNETLGTYSPGYFEIYVKTDKEIDLNKLAESEMSTFFHEWVHFLQDFTTGVGCMNSYVMIETLKYVGKAALNLSAPVPLPIPIGNDMNVKANRFISGKSWGARSSNNPHTAFTHVENERIPVPSEYGSNLPDAMICKVTTDTGETFEFGTYDIMESMASMCQREVFESDTSRIPVYPYRSVEFLVGLLNPKMAKKPLMMIALCDVTLMSSCPGVQMSSYLMRINNGNIPQPEKPEDIYDWFYRDDNKTNFIEAYRQINYMAQAGFLGILKDTVVFADFRRWIENAYSKALELRISDRYILLRLIREMKAGNKATFQELIHRFGTPLLRNSKYQYAKIPLSGSTGWDVEYLQAVQHIYKMLCNGDRLCHLIRWCMNSRAYHLSNGADPSTVIQPDTLCFIDPTRKVASNGSRCPVSFVWYCMGLPSISLS